MDFFSAGWGFEGCGVALEVVERWSPLTHDVVVCMWQTFWHSSAHVLGEALEATYGVKLTIGPAIDEGFYYDCYMGENRTLADGDRADINKAIERVFPSTMCTAVGLNARDLL
jgi:hypothetical protein